MGARPACGSRGPARGRYAAGTSAPSESRVSLGDCVLPGGTRRGGVLHWPRRTMRWLPDHHHRRSPRAAGAPQGGLHGLSARGWRGTADSLAWRPFLGSLLGLSRGRAPLRVGKAERGPVPRAPGPQAGRLGEEALLPSCSRSAALRPSHAASSSGPRPPSASRPPSQCSGLYWAPAWPGLLPVSWSPGGQHIQGHGDP